MPFKTLTAPGKTNPRTQAEGILMYSELPAVLMGELVVTAPDACEFTAGEDVIPVGNANYYLFAVVKTLLGPDVLTLTVNGQDFGSGPKSGTISLTASAGFDVGFLCSGGDGWATISSITCADGTTNDWLEIWAVPDPDQFTLWQYVRSYEMSSPHGIVPVADRFRPVATTLNTRGESSLTIGKDSVKWTDDFGAIRGKDITLILEDHPGGGGNVSEYKIMCNARVSAGVGAAEDSIVVTTSEGGFGALIVLGV